MRILVNTPTKLQNEANEYNAKPSYCNHNMKDKLNTSCRKLDGLFLNWPVESRAVTLATFIKEKWQRETNCQAALVYDPENPVKFEDLMFMFHYITHYVLNFFMVKLCSK